jgi:hypothetical protein
MGAGVATSPHCLQSFRLAGKPAQPPPSRVRASRRSECFGVSRAPRQGRSPVGSPLGRTGGPTGLFRSCRFRIRPDLRPNFRLATAPSAAPAFAFEPVSLAGAQDRPLRFWPVACRSLPNDRFPDRASPRPPRVASAWACTPLPLSRRLRQPPSPRRSVPPLPRELGNQPLRPRPGKPPSVSGRAALATHSNSHANRFAPSRISLWITRITGIESDRGGGPPTTEAARLSTSPRSRGRGRFGGPE